MLKIQHAPFLVAALCVVAAAGPAPAAEAPPAAPSAADPAAAPAAPAEAERARLQAGLHEHLDRLGRLGLSGVALVGRIGGEVVVEGFGAADHASGRPFTGGTVSTVGSITKQFTAAAILLLAEEGLLATADPLSRHLPGVPADKQGITLHHLLTHTAGFGELGIGDFEELGRDEMVRRALAAELPTAPGETYEYSNVGYGLLGAVIERLTGEEYERFLRRRLFLPAGMYETGYVLPGWEPQRLAQGVRDGEPWGSVAERLPPTGPGWVLKANGGIHSTVYDMFRWMEALAGDRVLSAASRQALFTPYADEGGGESFYGYGWAVGEVEGRRTVQHNGGNGVFFADLHYYPDDRLVTVYFTNVAERGAEAVSQVVDRLAFGEPVPLPPDVVAAEPAALASWEGTYRLAQGGAIAVRAEDGALALAPQGRQAFTAVHGGDAARAEALGAVATVERFIEGWHRGDFTPLWEAYRRETPKERLAQIYGERRAGFEEALGPWQGFEVLGVEPWPEGVAVTVRADFARGARYWRYLWEGGELTGAQLLSELPPPRFHPTRQGAFASYDLRSGRTLVARFEPSEGGARLVLETPAGQVTALRGAGPGS
ncbi:MAG TPA: serine hydrolase domain-containing protein [Thermoanaerobaculia bacterium]|nr:serine hydrolase domain-containing protein [Thermoanaerobaculia bacterium]